MSLIKPSSYSISYAGRAGGRKQENSFLKKAHNSEEGEGRDACTTVGWPSVFIFYVSSSQDYSPCPAFRFPKKFPSIPMTGYVPGL